MFPIIRLKTGTGDEAIIVVRSVTQDGSNGRICVYEMGEQHVCFVPEAGITLEDIEKAMDHSMQTRTVGRVRALSGDDT